LRDRVQGFGVDLSQPTLLVLVQWDALEAGQAARRLRAGRLASGAIFDDIDGVLTILCPASRDDDVRRAVADLGREAGAGGYRGIVSRPLAQVTELPAVSTALRRALPVLGRMGVQGHLVAQAEMALYATLFETHDQGSLVAFLQATLGPLLANDEKRGSQLAATLLCYFHCNQNTKAAAHRLDIHVNTMRQRLATIEGLVGGWNDADRALEIHVALRLWSLRGPARAD
ncbi:MAG: PucR family transcriptional regulator, partial [Comamonadaceae bacterium]